MTISVTHSTAADGTFSTEGAAAWDAGHVVSGLGTMAEQNANSVAITGGTISGVSITGTTITANTKFVSSYFDASGSGGGSLRNASGTALIQWGGGGGTNITISGATNINPANQQVDISPTGTGRVNIHPVGALDISPIALGTMDNVAIGATTASTGKFTSLVATSGIGGGTF